MMPEELAGQTAQIFKGLTELLYLGEYISFSSLSQDQLDKLFQREIFTLAGHSDGRSLQSESGAGQRIVLKQVLCI